VVVPGGPAPDFAWTNEIFDNTACYACFGEGEGRMTYAWRANGIALLITSALLMQSSFSKVRADVAPQTLQASTQFSCNRGTFPIILDVGHTAEEPGAISARGVPEFAFNVRLAQHLRQQLIGAGFAQTEVLITAGASFSGLLKRVASVNRMAPHLFLSIHHDSVPEAFLERWEYAGVQQRFSDQFRGHAIFISSENSHFQASMFFARRLGYELKAHGLQYASHYTQPFMGKHRRELLDAEVGVYRFDQLLVLRKTQVPAVLLEAGSIVNRDEELELGSRERQTAIGTAVSQAVEGFCSLPRP